METNNSFKEIMKESAKDRYRSVLKRFPEINEDEIEIGYDFSTPYACIGCYNDTSKGDTVLKFIVLVGPFFFELFDDGEKEAVIAHELGHYIYKKNHDSSKTERLLDEFEQLESYYKRKNSEEKIIITYSDKEKRRIKEIQDLYNTYEIYADNEAVKRGYGKQKLSALEKIVKKHYDYLDQMSKEAVKARIERLKAMEEKLGI